MNLGTRAPKNYWPSEENYPQPRARLQQVLSIDSANHTAHYNPGVLAAMSRDWGEAQQQLLSAFDTDPGSAEAQNTLGSVYFQRGQLEQAPSALEEAIRLQTEFAWSQYSLSLVLKKQERRDEAAQELRAALKADPQFQAARAELDRIEASVKRYHLRGNPI